MINNIVPFDEGAAAMAASTCFMEGEAKMSPHAAAERSPVPT